jgi:4-diphosphocytidyl-2-C-methyl-D-erythritol kinase
MLVFPKAKINLGLRITGKRADGFHNIETLFYPVGLCDALEMVVNTGQTGKDILTVTGYKLPGSREKNIVLRAIDKLRESASFPGMKIHLHKNIPAGAGLGGGSSDAACTLRTIKRIFNLPLGNDELKVIAATLGSDCPFFIDDQPALASGRGEILTAADNILDNFYAVLLNPGISISTKEAYDDCLPAMHETSLASLIKKPFSEWKDLIINDFEKTIFARYPQLRMIKEALYDSGAVYSSMSGSGSTVYGIFTVKPEIKGDLKKFVIFEGDL